MICAEIRCVRSLCDKLFTSSISPAILISGIYQFDRWSKCVFSSLLCRPGDAEWPCPSTGDPEAGVLRFLLVQKDPHRNRPSSLLKCFHRDVSGAKVKMGSKSGYFRPFSKIMLAFVCFKSGRGARCLTWKSGYECTIANRHYNYSMSFDSSRSEMSRNSIFRSALFLIVFSDFGYLGYGFPK